MHIHRFQRRHHILGISDLRMNDPELTLFNEPTCKKNKQQQNTAGMPATRYAPSYSTQPCQMPVGVNKEA